MGLAGLVARKQTVIHAHHDKHKGDNDTYVLSRADVSILKDSVNHSEREWLTKGYSTGTEIQNSQ